MNKTLIKNNCLILLHILGMVPHLISGWVYQMSPSHQLQPMNTFNTLSLPLIRQVTLPLADQEYHRHTNYSLCFLKPIHHQTFLFMHLFVAFPLSEEKLYIFLINKGLWYSLSSLCFMSSYPFPCIYLFFLFKNRIIFPFLEVIILDLWLLLTLLLSFSFAWSQNFSDLVGCIFIFSILVFYVFIKPF